MVLHPGMVVLHPGVFLFFKFFRTGSSSSLKQSLVDWKFSVGDLMNRLIFDYRGLS